MLTVTDRSVGESRQDGKQDGGFKFLERRCRDALGQVMGHPGLKFRVLIPTAELHVKPLTAILRFAKLTPDHSYRSPLYFREEPSKSKPLRRKREI